MRNDWPACLRAAQIGVVDPFAGASNGLYPIVRKLPGSKGIGFEIEPAIFRLLVLS